MRRMVAWLLVLMPALAGADPIARPDWMRWMPEGSESTWLGVAGWQYLALLLLTVVSYVLFTVLRVVIGKTNALTKRLTPGLIGLLSARSTRRALAALGVVWLWWVCLPELNLAHRLDRAFGFGLQFFTLTGCLWLTLSLWETIGEGISQRMASGDDRADRLLVPITRKLVRVIIWVAALLIGLSTFGVNVTAAVAGLGIGGLIVALAAKDSVENVFGSFTILFDMPFKIGDWVKIGDSEGIVEEINLRSTRIRTFEDAVITLPNSNLIKASVTNVGARRTRRIKLLLRVHHSTDLARLDAFCQEARWAISRVPCVRPEPLFVHLYDFSDSGAGILVQCLLEVSNMTEEIEARSEVLREIKRLIAEHQLALTGMPLPEMVPAPTKRQKTSEDPT